MSNIFVLHIALLNLPLKYFPKFSVRINLQTYMLVSLRMTISNISVLVILHFLFKIFTFLKILLSYVNPGKPLHVSYNQTYTFTRISHDTNGEYFGIIVSLSLLTLLFWGVAPCSLVDYKKFAGEYVILRCM